jgi:NAD(P)-dependent dehydrogenase (short-subunit alcohol dehydrogenase family)
VEYLDLLDLDGIDELAKAYEGQAIDVLVNNGALMRGPDKGQSFGSMDYAAFDTFFHINVRGPLKVSEAFWPHLKASEQGALATLTTSQGTSGIPAPGFAYYKSSKAAIDNLHLDIGRQGKRDGIRVMVLMPGRIATHGEKPNKFFTPVEDSVAGMISVINKQSAEQNGETFSWNDDPAAMVTDAVSEASSY